MEAQAMITQQQSSAKDTTAICARGIIRDFQAGQSTIRVLHGIDTDIRSGEMTSSWAKAAQARPL